MLSEVKMKIFDLHCDTVGECYKNSQHLRKNNMHLSLEGAAEYDEYCQVFAIWITDDLRGERAVDYFNNVADLYHKSVSENSDLISYYNTDSKTPVKGILACEGGSACGGTLQGLDNMYKKGVRLVTLTWNSNNEIGGGAFAEGGLTPFGAEFVKRCEDIGVIIDVSHLNRQSFWDVAKITTKPFVASHSNANIVDNFIPGEAYNIGGNQDWEMDIKDYSDLVLDAVGCDDSLVTYEEAEPFTTKVKTIDFLPFFYFLTLHKHYLLLG